MFPGYSGISIFRENISRARYLWIYIFLKIAAKHISEMILRSSMHNNTCFLLDYILKIFRKYLLQKIKHEYFFSHSLSASFRFSIFALQYRSAAWKYRVYSLDKQFAEWRLSSISGTKRVGDLRNKLTIEKINASHFHIVKT